VAVFNLGSLNIDYIYTLPHLLVAGETLSATDVEAALGGKGANQSLAIARAGGSIFHAGQIHKDDEAWLSQLADEGIILTHVKRANVATGHAIVMVDALSGENQIVLSPGANDQLPLDMIAPFLASALPQDWALSQNETNLTTSFLTVAKNKGMKICYSAAPFVAEITASLLPLVDLLIVNHIEAAELTAHQGCSADALSVPHLIITSGAKGADYCGDHGSFHVPAPKVEPVDTTGAGDTYLGYVLAGIDAGQTMQDAMHDAAQAAALQVARHGASAAIPRRDEIIIGQ
jgi:ribokinase